MSTPFLAGFSHALVTRLIREGLVEIDASAADRVMTFLANWLGTHAQGSSLLSEVERALLACPEVLEVYVDVDDLKTIVDDLA